MGADRSGRASGAIKNDAPTADDAVNAAHDQFGDASRTQMVDRWVAAAKGSQMTRAQLDEAITGAVKGGLLTDAEATAARQRLG